MQSLRNLWNYNKIFNIHVIGVLNRKKKAVLKKSSKQKWLKLSIFGERYKPIDSRS